MRHHRLERLRAPAGDLYHEFLRVPALSAGVYRIAADGEDPQTPHAEDELYHVVSGRASFVWDEGRVEVGPGSLLFVAAGVEHSFVDVAEDLVVLVVFAPAESG